MATTEITLSDGKPCQVRRLGIFDMDGVGPELAGPFAYTMTLANGEEIQDYYDPSQYSNPPQPPEFDGEIVEHSPAWWQLLEWETYKAAIAHEVNERTPSTINYVMEVSAYIVDQVLDREDRKRIVTEEDWVKVVEAALVPPITREVLAEAFRKHFAAQYDGQDVLDAIQRIEGGRGGYDALRVWEINAMGSLSEAEWASRPLGERARRVAAKALPKLIETLEVDRSIKEQKRKRGK